MLRSTEECGKAGAYGLRYMARGSLKKKYFHRFVRNEMLRREYLNQTFQVLPEIVDDYNRIVHDADFENIQRDILSSQGHENTSKIENYKQFFDGSNKIYFYIVKDISILHITFVFLSLLSYS